jgi:signal transduction histidine kinase
MNIRLLEVGTETDQLSSCRTSLILGVMSSTNLVSSFLKICRKMLQVEYGVLGISQEPYNWHSSCQGFYALTAAPHDVLSRFFQEDSFIRSEHRHYAEMSAYLQLLGFQHQRFIAFDLNIGANYSLGQVIFFDHQCSDFEDESVQLVEELIQGLISLIRQHEEYNELKELYEQQSALNFSKTKFFQIIAHDLRAPFHGLLGFSDVLSHERDTLDEASVQNISEYLYDTAQSTYNLLESLLNWAMAEGGRFVYHPINFELRQASQIVCNVLNGLALKKNIQMLNMVPEEVKVFADINMVTSVIQNLVSNALKFTYADGMGVVKIKASLCDERVCIEVQDSGLGMSQAQIATLFEPKLIVSMKGTAGEKGTGLGLVLCKRFVELNFGQIEIDSKEGQGTTFKVYLPASTHTHKVLNQEHDPTKQMKA